MFSTPAGNSGKADFYPSWPRQNPRADPDKTPLQQRVFWFSLVSSTPTKTVLISFLSLINQTLRRAEQDGSPALRNQPPCGSVVSPLIKPSGFPAQTP
jgi:hypothetical protein